MKEKVAEYRAKNVEKVAEANEKIMEKYLNGEELSIEEIKPAIRQLTIANKMYPVLCGSALANIGVQKMLDAVVDYLPNPLDIPPAIGVDPDDKEKTIEVKTSDDEPFSALAFKVATDPLLVN
jgi:elongation factor G